MSYIGDFALGKTFDVKFHTVNTSGAPTTLAGTPVISAYPDNSTTQLTAGITLTVDFDTVTGLHNIRVVATSGNGYATATNYALVITTGTVGGTSVVGYVVAQFSIEARSALRPTTADRTADVDASGGVEVGSFQTGAITAGAFAAAAIDAAAIAPSAIGTSELASAVDARVADAIWDEVRSGHVTQGTYGENQSAVISGAAIAGTLSTTQMTTDLTNATDDAMNGRTIVFIGNTTAALKGQATNCTDYTGATKLLTFTAVTTAPAAGDQFLIF